jgi:hypothetical protein
MGSHISGQHVPGIDADSKMDLGFALSGSLLVEQGSGPLN